MKTQLIIAAACAAALAAPAFAFAAPVMNNGIRGDGDTRQTTVSYADLNLNTSAGQATLETRIRSAARAVCGERPDSRDLGAARQFSVCVTKSIGAATAAVPAPTVVAGSAGHNG